MLRRFLPICLMYSLFVIIIIITTTTTNIQSVLTVCMAKSLFCCLFFFPPIISYEKTQINFLGSPVLAMNWAKTLFPCLIITPTLSARNNYFLHLKNGKLRLGILKKFPKVTQLLRAEPRLNPSSFDHILLFNFNLFLKSENTSCW